MNEYPCKYLNYVKAILNLLMRMFIIQLIYLHSNLMLVKFHSNNSRQLIKLITQPNLSKKILTKAHSNFNAEPIQYGHANFSKLCLNTEIA